MKLLIPLLCLSLVGCLSTGSGSSDSLPTVNAPSVQKMTMRNIHFEVKTVNGEPKVVMSMKDYENLALNMQELKRYILEQKELINFYNKPTKIVAEKDK